MDIPDDWQPTAANINALPLPLRRFIHDLSSFEGSCLVQDNWNLAAQARAVEAMVVVLRREKGMPMEDLSKKSKEELVVWALEERKRDLVFQRQLAEGGKIGSLLDRVDKIAAIDAEIQAVNRQLAELSP